MKISTRARYALRLMADIARRYDGIHPVHLRQIAEGNDLSHGYLEQLMISLRNAALVRGLSGRKGGYVLMRPANQIRVVEIVEAAIGPICLADCVINPGNCPRSPTCESRPIWVMLNTMIREVLGRYTLADMADAHWLEKIARRLPPSPPAMRAEPGFATSGCGSSRLPSLTPGGGFATPARRRGSTTKQRKPARRQTHSPAAAGGTR